MAINQSQNLNLQPGAQAQTVVHLSQGDHGNTLTFYLYNGSQPFVADGYSVSVHGVRQDGAQFGPIAVATHTGSNEVTVTVAESMTAVAGAALAELTISDGTAAVGTANFAMLVEQAEFPDGPIYSSDLSVYQNILNYVQSIPGAITAKMDAVDDALRNGINAEVAARTTADAVLQGQIDEFVQLSPGSTTGDAELTNIRVGANGITYNTAGDAVRANDLALQNQLNNLEIPYAIPLTWERGSLATVDDDGVEVESTTRIRTGFFTHLSNERIVITVPSGCELAYRSYEKSGDTYTCNGSIAFTSSIVTIPQTGYYYRLLLRYADQSTILPSAADDVTVTETVYTDTSLSMPGKAADAWATGDIFKLALSSKGRVQTDTDLNSVIEAGTYLFYAGHTYQNTPPTYVSGGFWLVVLNITDTQLIQAFLKTDTNDMFVRTYTTASTASWSKWTKYLTTSNLRAKTFSVLGDSISTYNGYNPAGYSYYYPAGNVDSVDKTWWKQLTKSNLQLVSNASWSGSGVCDDDNDPVNSAKVAYSDARIADLSDGSAVPDIIIVLIGTNDFRHDCQLGTLTSTDEIPDGTTSIRTFKEAYACMLNKIRTAYPHAHVYCCTLIQRYSAGDSTYPITNGNGNSLAQFNQAITDVATWIGCNVIRLDTLFSLAEIPDYTVDNALHPNAAGMRYVGNRILQYIVQNEMFYL